MRARVWNVMDPTIGCSEGPTAIYQHLHTSRNWKNPYSAFHPVSHYRFHWLWAWWRLLLIQSQWRGFQGGASLLSFPFPTLSAFADISWSPILNLCPVRSMSSSSCCRRRRRRRWEGSVVWRQQPFPRQSCSDLVQKAYLVQLFKYLFPLRDCYM